MLSPARSSLATSLPTSPMATLMFMPVAPTCGRRTCPHWLPILKQDTPGMPMVITETGYTTIPSNVDESSAAKYNLNTFFENALNGIVRTYLYELVDENSSATDTNV